MDEPITHEQFLTPLGLAPNDRLRVELNGKSTEEFRLQLWDQRDTPDNKHYPSYAARVEFPERFPEKRELKERFGLTTVVPCTDVTATVITKLWDGHRLSYTPDAEIVMRYLVGTVEKQRNSMRRTAEYHEMTTMRKVVTSCAIPCPQFETTAFHYAGGKDPMLHQRVAVDNSENSDGYGLFFKPGVGKTPTVIARIDRECQQPEFDSRMYRAIIVAPKNVRSNWVAEFERFSTQPGRAVVVRGNQYDRIKTIVEAMVQRPGQRWVAIVVSYECLSNSWDVLGNIEEWAGCQWDLAVLDEAHYIKWPLTKRAVYSFKLRDVSRQRQPLTGTPVCNTPIDLYSLFEFMRKGGSGFSSFPAFKKFYGVYIKADPTRNMKRLVDVQNLPFLRERLARMSMVVTTEEARPGMPAQLYDVHEVEMTSEQAQIYATVRDELYLEIKNELDDSERTMNPNNILTKLLRLSQITSGFLTFDPITDLESGEVLQPKIIERIDPNPKVDELIGMFKETDEDTGDVTWLKEETSKTIIGCCYVQDIKTISARLTEEGIANMTFFGGTSDDERAEVERAFAYDRDMRVIVMNPAAGGLGLNLLGYPPDRPDEYETNCDHVIIYSQNWSPQVREQLEGRPYRTKGTRVPIRYTDLCVPNTIDEEIRARVLSKKQTAMDVQNLKSILSKVLGHDF